MKKAVLFFLATFLLISSIAVPSYAATIKRPIVVLGGDPIPLPPPPL